MPFGGYHFIALGDFAQHLPPNGASLFHGASDFDYLTRDYPHALNKGISEKTYMLNLAGRRLWISFDYSIVLKQQHRFALDADGMKLYDLIYKVTHCKHRIENGGAKLTMSDVQSMADLINSTAISPADMPAFLALAPKAVVLRHNIRASLTRVLVLHHAAKANQRVITWRCVDQGYVAGSDTKKHDRKQELDPFVLGLLENESDNDTMPAVQYFYPGIPYRFLDTEYPAIGWFKNGTCIGETLVLDHREPVDDFKNDLRVLRYPPIATYVKIPHRHLGDLCGDTIPADCLSVVKKSGKAKTFTLPFEYKLFKDAKSKIRGKKITVVRYGMPLDCVLTYTDYFSQGMLCIIKKYSSF